MNVIQCKWMTFFMSGMATGAINYKLADHRKVFSHLMASLLEVNSFVGTQGLLKLM